MRISFSFICKTFVKEMLGLTTIYGELDFLRDRVSFGGKFKAGIYLTIVTIIARKIVLENCSEFFDCRANLGFSRV